ncbi:hypothetical protein HDU84_006225 [Entophlyctis sp. JEL0112]|nr:hypothetical protein HDU84_006225 [Entophlyctis sp. JEL0112]
MPSSVSPSISAVVVRREDCEGIGIVIVAMGTRRSWMISDLKLRLKHITGLLIHQQVVMFGEYQLTDSVKISKEELEIIDEHGGLVLRRRDQKNGTKRLFSKGIRSLATHLTRTFTSPDFILEQQQDVLEKAGRKLREQKTVYEQKSRGQEQDEKQNMDFQLSLDLEAELDAFWRTDSEAAFNGVATCAAVGEPSNSTICRADEMGLSAHRDECLLASPDCDVDAHGGAHDLLAFSTVSSRDAAVAVGRCHGVVAAPLLDFQLSNALEMNDVNGNCDLGFRQVFDSARRAQRKRVDGVDDLDLGCKLNNDIAANKSINFDDQQLLEQDKRLQEFFDQTGNSAVIAAPSDPRSTLTVDHLTKRIRLGV